MNWKSELAGRLIAARGAQSQASLAHKARVSDRTISLIETGKMNFFPHPRTIVKLALATGSDPVEWLTAVGRSMASSQIEAIRRSMSETQRVTCEKPVAYQGDLWKALYDLRAHLDARFDEITRRLDGLC
jgi:transcriptional regulator with XRE-family HTH domain